MTHSAIIQIQAHGICSHQCLNLLLQNTIGSSRTENGNPNENARAERVNGIIKTECNLHSSQLGFEQTYNQIKKCIKAYNETSPHSSCDYLTPNQTHRQSGNFKKRGKNNNKKRNFDK
jgi:putative transposase